MYAANSLNKVILKMVMLIIGLAPISLFALSARTFAPQGLGIFMPLAECFPLFVGTLPLCLLGACFWVMRVSESESGAMSKLGLALGLGS